MKINEAIGVNSQRTSYTLFGGGLRHVERLKFPGTHLLMTHYLNVSKSYSANLSFDVVTLNNAES